MRKFLAVFCSVALFASSFAAMPNVTVSAATDPYEFDGDIVDNPWGELFTTEAPTEALAITSQPQGAEVTAGDAVSLSVSATGEGLTYQWKRSTNGSTWTNVGTTSTITQSTSASHAGKTFLFKVVVTDASGNSVTSNTVEVVVKSAVVFAITSQPTNQTVTAGDKAKLSVSATGEGLTYQWKRSTNGSTWTNVGTTSSITQSTSASHAGKSFMFKCVITDASGATLTTNTVTVSVVAAAASIEITSQPTDQTVVAGNKATLSIKATGDGLTYQWKRSTNGTTWTNVGTTSTITQSTSANHAGKTFMFKCVVTDGSGNSVTSDTVEVSVVAETTEDEEFVITHHPVGKQVMAGDSVQIATVALGTGLTYRWEQSSDGGASWKTTSAPGYNTDTVTLSVQTKHIGKTYLYRCVVTDASGATLTSNPAIFEVVETLDLAITSQPQDTTVTVGDDIVVSVSAVGMGLTYQWMQSSDGGATWKASGAPGNATDTLRLTVESKHVGKTYLYKCVITDAYGESIVSDVATAVVK